MSPFYLMFGTHARLREDHNVRELLEREWASSFQEKRDELRPQAKENIAKLQQENKRVFDKKRKAAEIYREGDLVTVRRTQQVPGSKLAAKYFGPYEVTRSLRNNRYVVRKIGDHDGSLQTSTAADYMKPWLLYSDDEGTDDEGEERLETTGDLEKRVKEPQPGHSRSNVSQDGRV